MRAADNISYTASKTTQSKTASATGVYKVELLGASGGGYSSTYTGGAGGKATAYVFLKANETIYFAVGGGGSALTTSSTNKDKSVEGGWNGGGSGHTPNVAAGYAAGGGGGATSVSFYNQGSESVSAHGTTATADNVQKIIAVAGGGGGINFDSASQSSWAGRGGAGGGVQGAAGGMGSSATGGGAAGTQSGGGSFLAGTSTASDQGSGGGGGWYGGAAAKRGAGGGSGHIGGASSTNGTSADETVSVTSAQVVASDGRLDLVSGTLSRGAGASSSTGAGNNGSATYAFSSYGVAYYDYISSTWTMTKLDTFTNASTGVKAAASASEANLANATSGGHPLGGWTKTKGSTTVDYALGATVKESCMLYPVYTYTVTYMKADCSTSGETVSVSPGSATAARSTGVDTPSGYTLLGWATSSSTATPTYSKGASFTPTASVTLYPIYTRTISYNANGGTNPTASTQYYYGGSAKAVALAAGPSGRCLPGRGPGAFPQLAGPARAGRRGARRRSGRKARPGGPGSVPAGAQLGCSYARATPSGMWAAVVKWREPGGPWRQSSRTCGPERADAEAGLAAWRAELAGAGSCGPAPTVAELALAELASELASGRIERSTHDAQAGYARAHLSGTPLGDSPAGALTAAAALRWAESLAASLSPASARIAWGALRKAARRAAREGLLGGDPLAGLPAPRARRREPGSLDAPARAALAGAVAREWGAGSGRALAAALGLYAGLRAGECCALRWRDAAGGEVRVRAAAGRSQSGPYLKAPKSAASARSVPATAALAAALAERASALGGAPDPAGFCCSEDGALPDPKALSRDFSRLCAREGVRDSLGRPATFHSLRHTFATAAVAAGVDVKTLSAMLGHASAKLTLDVYAAADADARAAAAARMEGMYG